MTLAQIIERYESFHAAQPEPIVLTSLGRAILAARGFGRAWTEIDADGRLEMMRAVFDVMRDEEPAAI